MMMRCKWVAEALNANTVEARQDTVMALLLFPIALSPRKKGGVLCMMIFFALCNAFYFICTRLVRSFDC